MLVYYNGQCYDKDELLSHLTCVRKQLESLDEDMPEYHLVNCCPYHQTLPECCCTCPSNQQNYCNHSLHHCPHQSLKDKSQANKADSSKFQSPHYCQPKRNRVREESPIKCRISEICEREECSGCHSFKIPTSCRHHPGRKCIILNEKPFISKSLPCNLCLFAGEPHLVQDSPLQIEMEIEGSSPSSKKNCCSSEPHMINIRTKEGKSCDDSILVNNHCVVTQENIKLGRCFCCRNNGLQDHCRLCYMPRGRYGYMTNKK